VKNFRLHVLIRVILLGLAIFAFLHTLQQENRVLTSFFAALAILGLGVELVRYVEKTNRDLRAFLLSIKHNDFTNKFIGEKRGRSFAELSEAFNLVVGEFQNLRAEKESHYLYLQTVIEHVRIALLCFSPEGEVLLMNKAAKELLNKPYLSRLQALSRTHPQLLEVVEKLQPGERKLVKVLINHELVRLAVQSTEFKLQEQEYKLFSLQNIQSELEEQEIETWQKLIRVLTHEIMNSVTPIISLAEAIHGLLQQDSETGHLCDLEEEDVEDIRSGVQTIMGRSKGMLHFVNVYRNLSQIPKPNFSPIKPKQLIEGVQTLLQPELDRRHIALQTHFADPDLIIQGDGELLEQVLINLMKNAMEALESRPDALIQLRVIISRDQRVIIQVEDNGPGISDEFINQIFIPFFTTKKKGSGIGLSLSRQIMRMHRGNLSVQTLQGEGTAFNMVF
jgi:two-component system nitrogen regulation sensor histidine kinase NtrY